MSILGFMQIVLGNVSETEIRLYVKMLDASEVMWTAICKHVVLSEEFLKEYDKDIIKSLIFENLETCKNLSLDYIVSNKEHIKDIKIFKDILSKKDYKILKNLKEIDR